MSTQEATMTEDDLDKYLSEPSVRATRCRTCLGFAKACPDIVEFLRRKREGETHLPIYSSNGRSLFTYMNDKWGYNLTHFSLIRHINTCLHIDQKTGEPND